MNEAKTFRTKTGYCHILPDKIVLNRDPVFIGTDKTPRNNAMPVILVLYGAFFAYLVYKGYVAYTAQNTGSLIWCTIIALFIAWVIVRSWQNSTTGIIDRSSITKMKFKKAMPGLSRSYFQIYFKDAKGKTKRRLLMLPGSLSGGRAGTEEALKVMKEERLL